MNFIAIAMNFNIIKKKKKINKQTKKLFPVLNDK